MWFRAVLLGCALLAAPAHAVEYTLVFERSNQALVLEPSDWENAGSPFLGFMVDEPGYQPLFQASFSHGSSLAGLTLDFSTLNVSGFFDYWSTPSGFITFGDGYDIVSWDVADDATGVSDAAFAWHHRSDGAFEFRDSWLADTLNPEVMDGIFAHYGVQYTEPNFWHFMLAPGRWSCMADGMACGAVAQAPMAHVPIPASLGLLLGGLAGLAWAGRRRP